MSFSNLSFDRLLRYASHRQLLVRLRFAPPNGAAGKRNSLPSLRAGEPASQGVPPPGDAYPPPRYNFSISSISTFSVDTHDIAFNISGFHLRRVPCPNIATVTPSRRNTWIMAFTAFHVLPSSSPIWSTVARSFRRLTTYSTSL